MSREIVAVVGVVFLVTSCQQEQLQVDERAIEGAPDANAEDLRDSLDPPEHLLGPCTEPGVTEVEYGSDEKETQWTVVCVPDGCDAEGAQQHRFARHTYTERTLDRGLEPNREPEQVEPPLSLQGDCPRPGTTEEATSVDENGVASTWTVECVPTHCDESGCGDYVWAPVRHTLSLFGEGSLENTEGEWIQRTEFFHHVPRSESRHGETCVTSFETAGNASTQTPPSTDGARGRSTGSGASTTGMPSSSSSSGGSTGSHTPPGALGSGPSGNQLPGDPTPIGRSSSGTSTSFRKPECRMQNGLVTVYSHSFDYKYAQISHPGMDSSTCTTGPLAAGMNARMGEHQLLLYSQSTVPRGTSVAVAECTGIPNGYLPCTFSIDGFRVPYNDPGGPRNQRD